MKRYSKEEETFLRRNVERGASMQWIANKLGRSISSVRAKTHKLRVRRIYSEGVALGDDKAYVTIPLPIEFKLRLQRRALKEGLGMAQFIRNLIEREL